MVRHSDEHDGISLVIPAYNEAAVIEQAVTEALEALTSLGRRYELIVVDDGSTDGTGAIVQSLQRRHPCVQFLQHRQNRGYGAALATGFRVARYAWVAFTDADCQFDLRELSRLLSLADTGVIVVGWRVHRQDPWLRRFLSWGYNRLVRWLLKLPVHDVDCALKVYPRSLLRHLLPRTRGYFVNTEMLARAVRRGWIIREVAVTHRPRAAGRSKVGLGEVPRTAITLLRFCWQHWWWKRRTSRRRPQTRVWSGRLHVPQWLAAAEPEPKLAPSSAPLHPIGPAGRRPKAV